jgi:drug/metabolite transporter (DMT)-like permease
MTASTPTVPHHHSWRGVFLFVLSLLIFACMDTTIKYLAQSHPIPVIVAARYVVHTLVMLVILTPFHGARIFQTTRTRWVVLRGLALAVSSLLMGLALQRMPVAETTAIVFIAPLVVVLLSGPLLGEQVGPWGWVSAVLGFVGVVLIARPGSGLDAWGLLFAVSNVATSACYQMLSRFLASTERTVPMLFYSAALGALVFGALLPWTMAGELPTATEWCLLIGVGLAAGLGHYLYTAAYRQTPASVLAPLSNFQLVWAGLLGWLAFAHVPDAWSVTGMVIIAMAGAMSALRRRRA